MKARGSQQYFVAVTNNYSLAEAERLWRLGLYPGQHLWGYEQLDTSRFSARYFSDPFTPRLPDRLRRLVLGLVGEPYQQLRILMAIRSIDVIYAADQQSTLLLCLLRRLRLLRTPIVVMLHNGPLKEWGRICLRGADRLLCLDRRVADREELRHLGPATWMPWGPDLDYAGYKIDDEEVPTISVICSGKNNRDFRPLVQAIERLGCEAVLVGADPAHASAHIKVIPKLDHRELLRMVRRSAIVAMPLDDKTRLSGLTELADSIALGKPILASKGALLGRDIEEEGFGRYASDDTVDSWLCALQEILDDSEGLSRMRSAGLEYARTEANTRRFGERLSEELAAAIGVQQQGKTQ